MFKKKYTKNLDNLKNVKKSEFGIYLAASKKKFKKKYKNILTHKQGKKLIDEEELMIMRVYLNFKLKNNNFRKNITKLNSDVAYMCGISEVTLHRIKVKFDIDVQVNYQLLSKKEKNKPEYLIPDSLKPEIINLMKEFEQKGRPITSTDIREWLLDAKKLDVSNSTVLRALKRFEFKYSEIKCHDKNKFKESVIKKREEYSKLFHQIVEVEKYNPVYLDESYIVKNHCRNKTWNWCNNVDNFKKPKGKGNRIVIIGAIEINGFLKNSFTCWQVKKSSDYHTNLNKSIFEEYLKEKIIPNLESPSVIILDNASYHFSSESIDFNPFKANKAEIINFLKEKNIKLKGNELKVELKEMALQEWTPLKNKFEIFLNNYGHKLLFLPPYHPELNPIELAWARIKNYIADNPTYNTNTIMNKQLPKALKLVTPNFTNKIFRHCYEELENYRKLNKENQIEEIEYISDSENSSIYSENSEDFEKN